MATPSFAKFPEGAMPPDPVSSGIHIARHKPEKNEGPLRAEAIDAKESDSVTDSDRLEILRGLVKPGTFAFRKKLEQSGESFQKEYDRIHKLREKTLLAILRKKNDKHDRMGTEALAEFQAELIGILVRQKSPLNQNQAVEMIETMER